MADGIASEQALEVGKRLGLIFRSNPEWDAIFDAQTRRIHGDIRQARAANKFVLYLSCPISSRGGGFQATNVEIARYVAARIVSRLGDRFWVLNPCLYQHQSAEGNELLAHQSQKEGNKGKRPSEQPSGADYMRMWSNVLVGGGRELRSDDLPSNVDAFYFVGPRDVQEFFTDGVAGGLSASIENYLARKVVTEPIAFDQVKSKPAIDAFVRFYSLRASAAYSKGSHDEWNIFVRLNELRNQESKNDPGASLPGYFDGLQLDPGSALQKVAPGYAEPL